MLLRGSISVMGQRNITLTLVPKQNTTATSVLICEDVIKAHRNFII